MQQLCFWGLTFWDPSGQGFYCPCAERTWFWLVKPLAHLSGLPRNPELIQINTLSPRTRHQFFRVQWEAESHSTWCLTRFHPQTQRLNSPFFPALAFSPACHAPWWVHMSCLSLFLFWKTKPNCFRCLFKEDIGGELGCTVMRIWEALWHLF